MSVVIPVILCGGLGTRLWPLSRSDRPKQLVSLGGDHTLLEGTLLRAKAIAGAGDFICVTGAAYGAEVRQSLDRLGLRGRLLLEPEPRNTAPALCSAALVAMLSDSNAVIAALPSDHVVEDVEAFAASIALAVAAAEKNWLAVLGVRPRHASSSLGYIVPGAALDGLPQVHRVSRFAEKPEPELAASLVSTGALWNAGIVVARADDLIAAMRKHEPAVLEIVERALANGRNGGDEIQLDRADLSSAPRVSFDKAVLERHEAVAVTAFDAMWRDVGTWAEVAELFPADAHGNRQSGRVKLLSSHDSFVLSPQRLTVGIGLKDLIVIDTPDALLVVNRNDLGLVREAVEAMAVGSRLNAEVVDDQVVTKFVVLKGGKVSIRQPHTNHSRYWIVLQGIVRLTIKGQSSIYGMNESFYVPPGVFHTIGNAGSTTSELIEIHIIAKDFGSV